MKKQKILFIVLAISLLTEINVVSAKRLQDTALTENTHIDVVYSVKKYSLTQDYDIIIKDKGEVILYQYNYYDKAEGKPVIKNGKIPPDELQGFKEFIIDSDVFNFENDYVANIKTTELSSERIKFTIDGKIKEIVISAATIPARLRAIIERIEQIKSGIK
jgi:hypothetical protein